jgi:hypothetical protein
MSRMSDKRTQDKSPAASSHKKRILAYVKWGVPDEQTKNVPQEFAEARKLWKAHKDNWDDETMSMVSNLLCLHLRPLLVKDNMDEGVRDLIRFGRKDEIEAAEIRIYGVDFSGGPVPAICASALFDVMMTRDFRDNDELTAWMNKNGQLDSGVVFQFTWEDADDYIGVLSNYDECGAGLASAKFSLYE